MVSLDLERMKPKVTNLDRTVEYDWDVTYQWINSYTIKYEFTDMNILGN